MKEIILTLSITTILLTGAVFAQTDNDDTQFWNEATVEFPFDRDNKKVSGLVIGSLRVTDNITDLSDKRIGFAVKYKAHKLVTIQPSYLFRLQTPSGPNRYEHRLRLDITPKKTYSNFSIANRSRFEHRIKTANRRDETYYRNRDKDRNPRKKRRQDPFHAFCFKRHLFRSAKYARSPKRECRRHQQKI